MLLLTHILIGLNTILRRDRYDFSGLYITDKFCTDRIKGAAFRCKNIGIITFSDTERAESKWISGSDQLSWTHYYK